MKCFELKNEILELRLFAAKGASRKALQGVYFDTVDDVAIATDGYGLMQAPLPKGLDGKPFIIPADSLKIKRLSKNHIIFLIMSDDKSYIGQAKHSAREKLEDFESVTLINPINETYPNYQQVIPNKKTFKVHHEVGISADLLENLCAYIQKIGAKSNGIKFQLQADKLHAIIIEPLGVNDINGVIMPLRLGGFQGHHRTHALHCRDSVSDRPKNL